MSPQWLTGLRDMEERRTEGVLVTVASVRGHAPREAGAKMLVTATGVWDTVGGGNLEAVAIDRARRHLSTRSAHPELLTVALDDRTPAEFGRQCCGGEVTLLLEPLCTVRPRVAVFGVGHIGLALAAILSNLPVELDLVDTRPEQLTDQRLDPIRGGAARVESHLVMVPEEVLATLPSGAHSVIMTHDHAEDLALCDVALRRNDLGFVGLIGSSTKWARFGKQLRALGHTEAAISRITCPIGVPGICGKEPAVIALSVAAQLQQQLEAVGS